MEIDPVFLYHYTIWAMDRVITGAKQLTPDQLTAAIRPGFVSSHELLVHILAAEQIWLSRWKGESPRTMITIPTLDDLQAAWIPQRAAMIDFLATIKQADQTVTYRSTKGVEHHDILWQLILHVVNHGTEHRSQVALYLAMHGIDLGNLDVAEYLRSAQS